MCMSDSAPIIVGGGYNAKYILWLPPLSHKTSYNLHLPNLIDTDCVYDCLASWSEPAYVSHFLVTVYLIKTTVNVSFHQVT